MRVIRKMNKKVREHRNTLVESIKAADDLEKLIHDELEAGTIKLGSRDHLDAKKVLQGLRDSIGLAQRRSK